MAEFKPVVFKLDDELYGLDILKVQGIEREQQVVRVPNTATYIKGIMNLRGDVIPVYSLRKKFSLPEKDLLNVQYIIVRASGELIALEVDVVDEIHSIDSQNVHEVPTIVNSEQTRYFDKVLKTKRGLIITLDVDKLLSSEEIEQIAELKEQLEEKETAEEETSEEVSEEAGEENGQSQEAETSEEAEPEEAVAEE